MSSKPEQPPAQSSAPIDRFERLARAQAALREAALITRTRVPAQAQFDFSVDVSASLSTPSRADIAQKVAQVTGIPKGALNTLIQAGLTASVNPADAVVDSLGDLDKSKPDAARVVGRITHIRHHNEENGYTIFQVQPLGTSSLDERISVTGYGVDLRVGMQANIHGQWTQDPRYGRQLAKSLAVEVLPVAVQGIRQLLEYELAQDIGPVMSERLINYFGGRLLDVAQNQPWRLYELSDVDSTCVDALVAVVNEKNAIPGILSFLTRMQMGAANSHLIYKHLGSNAVDLIKANPYCLMDIDTISFKAVDRIGLALGIPINAESRITAAVLACLKNRAEKGSTAMPVAVLRSKVCRDYLGMRGFKEGVKPSADIQQALDVISAVLDRHESVVVRTITDHHRAVDAPIEQPYTVQVASLRLYAEMEASIARHLHRLDQGRVSPWLSASDFNAPQYGGLGEDQRTAAQRTITSPVSVITGRPGCGKTTVTKSILQAMQAHGLDVLLIAPTGGASARMTEATGYKSTTVHRALQAQSNGVFNRNAENPLQADVIFVDEMSIMSAHLMSNLLAAISTGTQLVMIGDKDQLRSIGAGQVLADVIASEVVTVSTLDTIRRQAANSAIITNAHRALDGLLPLPPQEGQRDDYEIVECIDPSKQVAAVIDSFKSMLARGFAPADIQLLTPLRRDNPLGSNNLNLELKRLLNPADALPAQDSIERRNADGLMTLSKGDRIMQTANNTYLGLNNGDIGYIRALDHQQKLLVCAFRGESIYVPFTNAKDLDLAYATTVYKAQGSEYKSVIIPLCVDHGFMWDRYVFNTAQTRGKERIALVGDPSVLNKAVALNENSQRLTGLRDALEVCFNKTSLRSFANLMHQARGSIKHESLALAAK